MSSDKKTLILIVEDDEFLRVLTAKRLEKEGFAIAVAVDGESALTVAEQKQPDLILLDLLLPGINGFEVLARLQKHESLKQVPVIVFSNLGQKEDIEKAQKLGAVDFLIKANFTLDDVVAKLHERLEK